MGLPLAGMVIEAKSPMVVGSSPPASNDAFLDAAMRCDWVLNFDTQRFYAVSVHQTEFASHKVLVCMPVERQVDLWGCRGVRRGDTLRGVVQSNVLVLLVRECVCWFGG